jgi:hypothetical protein
MHKRPLLPWHVLVPLLSVLELVDAVQMAAVGLGTCEFDFRSTLWVLTCGRCIGGMNLRQVVQPVASLLKYMLRTAAILFAGTLLPIMDFRDVVSQPPFGIKAFATSLTITRKSFDLVQLRVRLCRGDLAVTFMFEDLSAETVLVRAARAAVSTMDKILAKVTSQLIVPVNRPIRDSIYEDTRNKLANEKCSNVILLSAGILSQLPLLKELVDCGLETTILVLGQCEVVEIEHEGLDEIGETSLHPYV